MSNDDSVTQWIVALKRGDEVAAQRLWDRYFTRLAGIAGKRLQVVSRLPTDGEDVALSALHSLCAGMNNGKFNLLADRDSLWKLLVAITVRKVNHAIRDEFRQKRGGGKTVGESALFNHDDVVDGARGLEIVLDREPTPDFVIQIQDEIQRLFSLLPDEELKKIATWKMQGLTSQEIASQLGKALATVERRLKLIRALWEEHLPGN